MGKFLGLDYQYHSESSVNIVFLGNSLSQYIVNGMYVHMYIHYVYVGNRNCGNVLDGITPMPTNNVV